MIVPAMAMTRAKLFISMMKLCFALGVGELLVYSERQD